MAEEELDLENEDASGLRKRLGEEIAARKAAEEQKTAAEAELLKRDRVPLRNQAFKDLGVDFEALRPAEKERLEGFEWDGDKPDHEQVAAFISRYELPTTQTQDNQQTPSATQQIVNQALSPGVPPGTIENFDKAMQAAKTPQEVIDLAAQKRQALGR